MIAHVQLLIDDAQPDLAEERARTAQVPPGFERGFMAAHLRHCEGAAQLAQGKFDAGGGHARRGGQPVRGERHTHAGALPVALRPRAGAGRHGPP